MRRLVDLKHLREMSKRRLKEIDIEVQAVSQELESAPVRRDIDIAAEHTGREELIQKVIRTKGDETTGRWQRLEKIYCLEHCAGCPHGPFWFRYSRNKRKNTLNVEPLGRPAFSEETLERMSSTATPGVPYVPSLNPTKEE